ncbi:MAG: hypothetical protein N3F08_05480 [Crenarchaeota archaeon]|nr:hypothetical protein [Thermoproteota archaeon]
MLYRIEFWAQASRLILPNPLFNKPEEDAFTPQHPGKAASTSPRVSRPVPMVEAACTLLKMLRPASELPLGRSLVCPVQTIFSRQY